MSKVTKKQLQRAIQRQESRIDGLVGLLAKKGYYDKEPEPQPKQLDQSVFDDLDKGIDYAAVKSDGEGIASSVAPILTLGGEFWGVDLSAPLVSLGRGYDTTNWQYSLIERESKELTGSELCRAMLARGDARIMCKVYDIDRQHDITHVIRAYSDGKFHTKANRWTYAIPINNQGEPLTQAEAGL